MFHTTTLQRPDGALIADECGEGPQALLLHAGGERRQVWHPIMTTMAQLGVHSIAFDQRGHGESAGSRGDPVAAFGADTVAMIERSNMPVVVGASLGGFAAMLALREADTQARVAGLVLVDVVADPNPDRVRPFLRQSGMTPEDSPLVEEILRQGALFRESASRLDLPVLLIRAGLWSPLDDDVVDRFCRLVPHLAVTTIAGAGHLIARDAPFALATALIAFISAEPGCRPRRARSANP